MSDRTRAGYDAAFQAERMNDYPVMDELEARLGYAVDRTRLEAAARVLACPLKKNPPNWQHGRLIYALGRAYLAANPGRQTWVDIGTAKGFSACVMSWALADGYHPGDIHSWDIINPLSRDPRNSVEDGKTIHEFVAPFRAPDMFIGFSLASDAHSRAHLWDRVNLAFVDGSHTYDGVKADIELLVHRQLPGDIIVFDDMQVPGVAKAVFQVLAGYDVEMVNLMPTRRYAIARRQ